MHHFEIRNYSRTKGCGIGESISSSSFYVEGHCWRIRCFLDGYTEQYSDYISAYLDYYPDSGNCQAMARAKFSFSLLEHTTGAAIHTSETSMQFSRSKRCRGWPNFIKRQILEESLALKDDSFTIICNVTLIAKPRTSVTRYVPHTVNPSNLFKTFETHVSGDRKLADIIFEVDGKSFSANSTVVASSSAQLSNLIIERKDQKIKISDIKAPVFEALLQYINTEDLPKNEMLISTGMVPNLLVAADRFGMHKLKKNCEKKLSEGVDAQNVCTLLVLAIQCRLIKLKDACLNYLSAPEALVSAMATIEYIHLIRSYPNIAKEISSKVQIN